MRENFVILVGGAYGSGKTTIGNALRKHANIVDYDTVIGNSQGNKVKAVEVADLRLAWQQLFFEQLQISAEQNRITVGLGTFTTRERRDRYFDGLSEVSEVLGLYYMLPMRTTIQRIKDNRSLDHLVNGDTVTEFYRIHNNTFRAQDNNDLLLPKNPMELPGEYISLLKQSEYDPAVFPKRWIVTSVPLNPLTLLDLINSGTTSPSVVRDRLSVTPTIEQSA